MQHGSSRISYIGLTRAEADSFDVLQGQSYIKLIGKEVGVAVIKTGKYHEVDETWPAADFAKREKMPKKPPAAAPPPTADGNDGDDEDLQL